VPALDCARCLIKKKKKKGFGLAMKTRGRELNCSQEHENKKRG
jgi:hypothetical protein